MEEGPWTSQPSGGEMVKDDGIEMQHGGLNLNHEKSYSSDTSWASCRAMSSVSPVTAANFTFPTLSLKFLPVPYTCTWKFLVPATARTHVHGSSSYKLLPVHMYTEVPHTSYCPYTRTWKFLVPATARTSLLFVLTSHQCRGQVKAFNGHTLHS